MIFIKKYIIWTFLIILSFYVSEKTAEYTRNQDPILNSIKEVSSSYNEEPVNAIIDGNYIIPGHYGKKVNELKSLSSMRLNNTFNELYLVTDKIKPDISIENNKDKIINKCNPKNNMISLIIDESNTNIISYLKQNNIKASILITTSYKKNSNFEYINNNHTSYLKTSHLISPKNNLCIINSNIESLCRKYKKYLIKPTYNLTNTNLINIKNNIEPGLIIYIETTNQTNLNLLIKYIKSKNINIDLLSKNISEYS